MEDIEAGSKNPLFYKYLLTLLEELNTDGKTFADYIFSILSDKTSDFDSKVQGLVEILSMLIDADISEEGQENNAEVLSKKILKEWEAHTTESEKKSSGPQHALPERNNIATLSAALKTVDSFNREIYAAESLKNDGENNLLNSSSSKSDAAHKDQVIKQYGIQMVDITRFDDEGNIIPSPVNFPKVTETDADSLMESRNDNAGRVKQQEAAQRLKQKLEHQANLEKQQLQKQKLIEKKQKEKQRTAKHERRTGR